MSHDAGMEHEVAVDRIRADDGETTGEADRIDLGADPGALWEVRSIDARLHVAGTGSAGQFTRFLASLQVGFEDDFLVAPADLDSLGDPPPTSDRLLFFDVDHGAAQVIDTTDGAGAGPNEAEIRYRDVFGPEEMVIPYPGELLIGGAIQNNLGGGTLDVEGHVSVDVKYQRHESDNVPAHGVLVR